MKDGTWINLDLTERCNSREMTKDGVVWLRKDGKREKRRKEGGKICERPNDISIILIFLSVLVNVLLL